MELRGSRKYYSIDNLSRVFGYTRQAWYNHLKRTELQVLQEHIILQKIIEIRSELPKTGCIKLYKTLNNGFLQSLGISMGRDAIFDLVRSNGMLVKSRRKRVYTTNSFHRYKIHPDLVQRRPATRSEEIWVSDITYITLSSGFAFLSLVTDAYSRKIVGCCLSRDLKAIGCINALNSALQDRVYLNRMLIHHSDRGTQYCCDDYISILKATGVQISMTQTGSPYDNAIAERVNGILKIELQLDNIFKSFDQALLAVRQAVYKYNHLRLHTSCGFKTPEWVHMEDKLTQITEENNFVNQ